MRRDSFHIILRNSMFNYKCTEVLCTKFHNNSWLKSSCRALRCLEDEAIDFTCVTTCIGLHGLGNSREGLQNCPIFWYIWHYLTEIECVVIEGWALWVYLESVLKKGRRFQEGWVKQIVYLSTPL